MIKARRWFSDSVDIAASRLGEIGRRALAKIAAINDFADLK
jgi:hypothetical protein